VWKGVASYLLGQLPVGGANRVRVELFITNDAGLHWTGPVVLGENPARDREHVWLAYSPAGVLGVIWRTHLGACCFGSTETWAVISRDGGTTFALPQELSHASSPFTKGLGDDYESVAADGVSLHAMWSDGRSGTEEIYYGRLSLAGF
jgi:hypothetical protein